MSNHGSQADITFPVETFCSIHQRRDSVSAAHVLSVPHGPCAFKIFSRAPSATVPISISQILLAPCAGGAIRFLSPSEWSALGAVVCYGSIKISSSCYSIRSIMTRCSREEFMLDTVYCCNARLCMRFRDDAGVKINYVQWVISHVIFTAKA